MYNKLIINRNRLSGDSAKATNKRNMRRVQTDRNELN